jgi:hypothetical protein
LKNYHLRLQHLRHQNDHNEENMYHLGLLLLNLFHHYYLEVDLLEVCYLNQRHLGHHRRLRRQIHLILLRVRHYHIDLYLHRQM